MLSRVFVNKINNLLNFIIYEADYPNYPAVGFEGIPTDEIARLVGEIILGENLKIAPN